MKNTRSNTKIAVSSENMKNSETSKNVFLLKENLINFCGKNTNIKIEKLRHPGNNESVYFILPELNSNETDSNSEIYEIVEFDQIHRSWLINNSFTSNGRLYITLQIDSLFFALYYLRTQCKINAKSLEQLQDEEFPKTINFLTNSLTSERLKKIADEKIVDNLRFYKYNHDKTIQWLSLKVKYLAYVLRAENISASTSATSANYTKSGNVSADYTDNDYLQLASEIVSAYIETDLHNELNILLGIKNINIASNKRKSSDLDNSGRKKRHKIIRDDDDRDKEKTDSITTINTFNFNHTKITVKDKKQTTKEKSLAKAACGSKNIASFFKTKNKS